MKRPPPTSTLFPYTTLFRSRRAHPGQRADRSRDAERSLYLRPLPARQGHRPDRRGRVEAGSRSEEHTSELQSHSDLVCRLLLEKKKQTTAAHYALGGAYRNQ